MLFWADSPRAQAIAAQTLFLANLLVLPGIGFILLCLLWANARPAAPLADCHLRQTLAGSLWAGGLLVIFSSIVFFVSDYQNPATWVFIILYFITVHAYLVLCGALGLSRAIAGQPFRFPVVGVDCAALAPEVEHG